MAKDRIAHFEVTGELGAGAMGEVYRARDTKLDREVAIKVLPESFAARKESLSRFEREAKLLASLNHAHIATVYGTEEIEGSIAIVMELVDGETLEQRLRRGPIELAEALPLFRQIAEALEAAHEKGIVHRDLKPGNIKFAADGKVKVLDFGLAKAVANAEEAVEADADASTLPVDTTVPGMVLGTPAYMSPEQTRGQPVDKRSDVWAFGCCLYEALTGRKPFKAQTGSDMMAEVLKSDPDYTIMPAETPADIFSLLRRCLQKEPRRRLRDIGDIAIRLDESMRPEDVPVAIERVSERRRRTAILVVVMALAAALFTWVFGPTPSSKVNSLPSAMGQLRRHLSLNLGLDATESIPVDRGTAVRLSPDGQLLGYIRLMEGESNLRRLYVQRLDGTEIEEASLLVGTEGVYSFCFSPDGDQIAFLVPQPDKQTSHAQLKIVPVGGGEAWEVGGGSDLHRAEDLHWEREGIILSTGSDTWGVLAMLSDTADTRPENISGLGDSEWSHRAPQLLPGGETVLYSAYRVGTGDFTNAKFMVKRCGSEQSPVVVAENWGYDARYLPSGHLVYAQKGTLFAAAFDPESPGKLKPVAVIKNVVGRTNQARAQFDISNDGSLVYLQGPFDDSPWHFTEPLPLTRLEWIDREGMSTAVPGLDPGYYGNFKLSPDGKFLAFGWHEGNQWDIWVHDLQNDESEPKPITHNENEDDKIPAWSSDGRAIVFSSNREGVNDIYWMPIHQRHDAQLLREKSGQGQNHREKLFRVPLSWDPTGSRLAIMETDVETSENVRILNLIGAGATGWRGDTIDDFRVTGASEIDAVFSADGSWLAYATNHKDRVHHEVSICPNSLDPREGIENRIPISPLGTPATDPRWSSDNPPTITFASSGSEQDTGQVYAVPLQSENGTFLPGAPERWKNGTYHEIAKMCGYDLDPNSERILVRRLAEEPNGEDPERAVIRVVLFENFVDYLREKVPSRNDRSSN